jgi:hypothetical protein
MSKKINKEKPEVSQVKQQVMETYLSLISSGTLFPSLANLKSANVTREQIRHHFNSLAGLRKIAKIEHPEVFSSSLNIDEYLSDKNLNALNKRLKQSKTLIITTAVSGQKAHPGFMANLETLRTNISGKTVILPSHDPAHNLDNEIDWTFDPSILKHDIVFEETSLNSNFFISGIRVTAKQINPITGLNELSQKKGSFISASPKQVLEYDAVSANKLPHARMTSGACTVPNYSSSRGNSQRSSYIADIQHTLGAVVITIEDDISYDFKQIQAQPDGSFCFLENEYKNGKVSKLKGKDTPVLVMGDYHAGEHDESAVGAWIEVINELGIEEVVFHDMFNGTSINPHEELDIVLRSERADKGLNSLRNELKITSEQFDRILGLKSVKKGVVVKSNHDDMLDRWLKKGAFAKDPVNFKIGVDLASALTSSGKDYLKEAISMVQKPKHMNKLKWLTMDEDYVVGGVHLGAHGDKGANGSRGSIKGMAKAYPRCVIGHSHTPGIFKGAFQVGTTSLLRLGYNRGASSWMHCSALVYRNGQVMLINSIKGKWKIKK